MSAPAEKGLPSYLSGVVPPSRTAALAAKALEYSQAASQAMWKHILLVLGVMLYIAFVVMATVFYYPSYYACMIKCGTLWALANAIVHAVFMIFLVFYVVRQFFDTGSPAAKASHFLVYIQSFDHMLPYILAFCVGYLVISYGILFFTCRTLNSCDGCTPAEQTAFNTLVTAQVNRSTPMLKELQVFYEEYAKNRIGQIASCTNYYNSAYVKSYSKDSTTTQCAVSATAEATDFTIEMGIPEIQPLLQQHAAPLLGQFYVMTSGRTCVVGNQYDSYVSPAMIPLVLNAGARCLDFQVTSFGYSRKSFPIVTNARNKDNVNLQRNFVLFEDVLRTIIQTWGDRYNATPGMGADPLFVRLTLDKGLTLDSMNQMGYLIKYYLGEVAQNFLLEPQYNYQTLFLQNLNIGSLPLMMYVNHIVIMVFSPCANVTDSFLNSYLNDVTNDLCTDSRASVTSGVITPQPTSKTTSCNSITYRTPKLPSLSSSKSSTGSSNAEYTSLLNYNRMYTSFVETNFTPSNNVNTFASCTPTIDKATQTFSGDNDATLTQLLANKQTINNDPTNAFACGCQFIAMNFQDLSPEMKLYLSVFDKTSFVLKPSTMWATDTFSETKTVPTSCMGGDITYVYNDTSAETCYEVCVPSKLTSDTTLMEKLKTQKFAKVTNSTTCIRDGNQLTIETQPIEFPTTSGDTLHSQVYAIKKTV